MVEASLERKGGGKVVEGVAQRLSNGDERRPAVGNNSGELLKHREREEGVRN
jgi:hypothetical protein